MADHFEFFFNEMPVGYFLELAAYPEVPGTYRYMPLRGPGHYEMGEEFRRTGLAKCSYPTPAGEGRFIVRARPEYGVLVIDACSIARHGTDEQDR